MNLGLYRSHRICNNCNLLRRAQGNRILDRGLAGKPQSIQYWHSNSPIRIPRHHRTARVSASDADDEGIDEDLAILVSLKEHMSQEAIEEQLVKNGLKPTGDLDEDLVSLLPFEKARRESEQLLVSADPTIAAGELPETKEWVGDDEIDGRLFEDTEDLDDSEFAEEEDPAIAEAEAKTIEEGDSGTVAELEEIRRNLEEEIKNAKKLELQERLKHFKMKITGTKVQLGEVLLNLYMSAARAGLSPEDYRDREMFEEQKPAEIGPETDMDDALDRWSLTQLRQAAQERGIPPRGNKADLVAMLRRPNEPAPEPTPETAEDSTTVSPPWTEVVEPPPPPPPPPAEAASGGAESERERQKRELSRLTVSEILALLRNRRIPIGANKRKDELIDRLLNTIHPGNMADREQPQVSALEDEGQQEIDRADLGRMLKRLLPDWSPNHLREEIKFMPVLQLQQELQELGVSSEGSRTELIDRLQKYRPDLWDSLASLSLEDAKTLLNRMGFFDGDDSDDTESITAKLYEEIVHFNWFDPEVSNYQEQQLIPKEEPSLVGEVDEEEEEALRVAVVTVLNEGLHGDVALRSVQSVVQYLQTTTAQGVLGRGIDVTTYVVTSDRLFKCTRTDICTQSSASLLTSLESRGVQIQNRKALVTELQSSSDVVLPVLPEGDRSILDDLEEAGLDFIGSSALSRETAANKYRCRDALKKLGYPTFPQLHLLAKQYSEVAEADLADKLKTRFEQWLSENNIDISTTAVLVKPAVGSSGVGLILANGAEDALESIASLFDAGMEEIVVEPLLRDILEFSTLVVGTQEGPVASMPLQIRIYDSEEMFIDAELELQRFLNRVKGWTNDEEAHKQVWAAKEQAVISNPSMVLFDSEAKHMPSSRLSIQSPPQLPVKVTLAIREAAAKVFIDLQLKDYAVIEGFVQLPHKGPQPRESLEELEGYEPPNVNQLAHRLRKNDNSDLIPPWDPPGEVQEELSEADQEAYLKIFNDPDFKDMGPYTDSEVAKDYHSNDVELRVIEEGVEPRAEVVEPEPLMTDEEAEEFLREGNYWDPELYTPDEEMFLDLDDGEAAFAAELDKKEEAAAAAAFAQYSPQSEEEGEAEGKLVVRDDEDGLGEALVVDIPHWSTASVSDLCRHKDMTILIADVNVSPSLESNSLLFRAAAHSGLSHTSFLRQLVTNSCTRQGIEPPLLLPVEPIETSVLAPLVQSPPELTWDMFPPVTEREWALPWHHERFKLRDNPEAFQTGRSGQEGDKSIWREDSQDEGFSGGSTDTEAGNESYQQIGSGASQGAGPGSTSTASRRASEDESDGVNLEGPLARVLAEEAEADTMRGEDKSSQSWRGDGDGEVQGDEGKGERLQPQLVWVLCGGGGSEADASLASGIHVYHELLKQPDVLAEIFVLTPPCSGIKELDRRKELLNRHVQRVKLTSDPFTEQPEALQLQNIRNPPQASVNITERLVWAVPPHLLLHHSVNEVHQACETATMYDSVIERLRPEWQQGETPLRDLVVHQLQSAGVAQAGGVWGLPCTAMPPRCFDMYEWSIQARRAGAVIFSALQSGIPETGQLTALLDNMTTIYTGSGTLAAATCSDKGRMADSLAELDLQIIETPPKYEISLPTLLSCLETDQAEEEEDEESTSEEIYMEVTPAKAERLLEEARQTLGLQSGEAVLIKPGVGSGQAGVCRLNNAGDLLQYILAVRNRLYAIPELFLSWVNPEVQLPVQHPGHYYLEPFTAADSLVVQGKTRNSGSEVTWLNSSHWVETHIGLLGSQGYMMAMTPTLVAHTLATEVLLTHEDGEEEGSTVSPLATDDGFEGQGAAGDRVMVQGQPVHLCPPPEHILPPLLMTSVQERAEYVARQLDLSGLASLQGYINADTGELRVVDIDTSPPLHAGSHIWAQVAQIRPEVTPGALLRRLAWIASIRAEDPNMSRALTADVTPPDYDMEGELCTYPGLDEEEKVELVEPVASMLRALHNQSEDILNFGHSPTSDVMD